MAQTESPLRRDSQRVIHCDRKLRLEQGTDSAPRPVRKRSCNHWLTHHEIFPLTSAQLVGLAFDCAPEFNLFHRNNVFFFSKPVLQQISIDAFHLSLSCLSVCLQLLPLLMSSNNLILLFPCSFFSSTTSSVTLQLQTNPTQYIRALKRYFPLCCYFYTVFCYFKNTLFVMLFGLSSISLWYTIYCRSNVFDFAQ